MLADTLRQRRIQLGQHEADIVAGMGIRDGTLLGRNRYEKDSALNERPPDPQVETIVAGWPERADATRARELGFVPETSFDEIVRIHIEDELGGTFVG